MSISTARVVSLSAAVLCAALFGTGCMPATNSDAPLSFLDYVTAANPNDVVLLVIENLTGFDLSVGYEIDGEFGGVLVFDGETLYLERDCFTDIELLYEDHFDIATGEFVESFELTDSITSNPADFACGDALILTFGTDEIMISSEPLAP